MININEKNFIVELKAYDQDWGVLSLQDDKNQSVYITNKLNDTVKLLENSGFQNLHKSDYSYLVHTYGVKPDKFAEMASEVFKNKQLWENTNMINLRSNLDKLRNVGMITDETEHGGMVKTLLPAYAVYQRDVVSLKIPTHFSYDNETRWDYEYLIYPLTDMFNDSISYNENLINLINKNTEDYKIDVNDLPKVTDDMLLTCFTPNRYRLARFEYSIISMYTKGLIRILRNVSQNETMNSRFYDIYQNSRMAKTEKLGYVEIQWKDAETNEYTFPELCRTMLGIELSALDEDSLDKALFALDNMIEQVKQVGSKVEGYYNNLNGLKALRMYKEYSEKDNVDEIVEKYEELERKREKCRENIFYMNLNLRCRVEDFVDLYKKTELSWFINVDSMDFRIDNNPIEIIFKKKLNTLTINGEDSLNWNKKCIF